MNGALDGCRVVVTRERPGELAALLGRRGATVVHVPLIEVIEPADGGRALRTALAQLDRYDWVIVTSAAGAERVGAAVGSVRGLRLGAVGAATARVLSHESGRSIDLVPDVQRADALAEQFNAAASTRQRVLIAQADIASPTLADALRQAGHEVTAVTAYRTVAKEPVTEDALRADAVLFASGSSVESWYRAFGSAGPPLMIAIGPSTAEAARRLGLKLSSVATDHSLEGLVNELERLRSSAAGRREDGLPRPN